MTARSFFKSKLKKSGKFFWKDLKNRQRWSMWYSWTSRSGEMADALDSKSGSLWECGFKSHLRYQFRIEQEAAHYLPLRCFVAKVHIDLPLEISGSWYICLIDGLWHKLMSPLSLKFPAADRFSIWSTHGFWSRKVCFISHLILLLNPSIFALLICLKVQ